MLTIRQKKIITMLVETHPKYITISEIASRLTLSERTVKRDLILIEEWFIENDFKLLKKPGVGITIDESGDMVNFIMEILQVENFQKSFSKEDRIKFILSRLLVSREPIKSFLFLNYLKISDKTLLNDLSDIEIWMSPFNLKLVRKPGEGISIEGSERAIRAAQINLIYETYGENHRIDLMDAISEISTESINGKDEILSMLEPDIVKGVREVINSIFSEFKMEIADNSYIGLLVHISIAISRISSGEKISMENDFFESIRTTKEYELAKYIVKRLESKFSILISDYEAGYIAMHIRGAKFASRYDDIVVDEESVEVLKIATQLIDILDNRLSMNLVSDLRLKNNLIQHLQPALTRLKMNMRIQNPILDDIKERFRYLFDIISVEFRKIVGSVLKDGDAIDIPDDEVAYITIHFASAIERIYKDSVKINAVLSCPTGIGTSGFLQTRLENIFNRINIVDRVSVVNIKDSIEKHGDVDIIISTVEIDKFIKKELSKSISTIVVNPLLREEDVSRLNKKISEISRYKLNEYTRLGEKEKNTKEMSKIDDRDIRKIIHISHTLSEIIDRIKILEIDYSPIENIESVVEKLAKEIICDFSDHTNDCTDEYLKIVESIKRRNEIQIPYFEEFSLVYFHAEVDIKKAALCFSKSGNESIIMALLPKNAEYFVREFLSEISISIVDKGNIIQYIQDMDIDRIRELLLDIVENIIKKVNYGG